MGEERLLQTARIFLRNDDVFVLRKFRLDDLMESFVVIAADDCFFDIYSECTDVFDESLGIAEPANGCSGKRFARCKVCDGLDGKIDGGRIDAMSVVAYAIKMDDLAFVVVLL